MTSTRCKHEAGAGKKAVSAIAHARARRRLLAQAPHARPHDARRPSLLRRAEAAEDHRQHAVTPLGRDALPFERREDAAEQREDLLNRHVLADGSGMPGSVEQFAELDMEIVLHT